MKILIIQTKCKLHKREELNPKLIITIKRKEIIVYKSFTFGLKEFRKDMQVKIPRNKGSQKKLNLVWKQSNNSINKKYSIQLTGQWKSIQQNKTNLIKFVIFYGIVIVWERSCLYHNIEVLFLRSRTHFHL